MKLGAKSSRLGPIDASTDYTARTFAVTKPNGFDSGDFLVRLILAAIAACVLIPSAVFASSDVSAYLAPTVNGQQISFGRFDGSLGTLQGVIFDAVGNISITGSAVTTQPPSGAEQGFAYELNANLFADSLAGLDFNGHVFNANNTVFIFGEQVGQEVPISINRPIGYFTGFALQPSDLAFSQFLGNGQVTLTPQVTSSINATQVFNLDNLNLASTFALTLLSVTYIYQPAAAGAVPEPASWAMMIGGFGLVGGAMRAKRRSATRVLA